VRRKGRSPISRNFRAKSEALAWAREQELEADQRRPQGHKTLRAIRVADIVKRYRDEVVPRKRGADRETLTLNAFLRHPLALVVLSDVTTGMVSAYCAERLQCVQPGTLNRELDILRHAFAIARRNWDVPLAQNPFADVIRPKAAPPRERRLHPGEHERLMSACIACRNRFVRSLVQFALETGMRRGEILRTRWSDVSLEKRTLHIPLTKNGHARTIPLSSGALAILRTLSDSRTSTDDRVLPISDNSAKMAWKRLVKRARLENLRFHDLRHEAISRFFEIGLSVPEVALISGHRDPRMLFRYTHPRAEDIAMKLQ
jgi:integrase